MKLTQLILLSGATVANAQGAFKAAIPNEPEAIVEPPVAAVASIPAAFQAATASASDSTDASSGEAATDRLLNLGSARSHGPDGGSGRGLRGFHARHGTGGSDLLTLMALTGNLDTEGEDNNLLPLLLVSGGDLGHGGGGSSIGTNANVLPLMAAGVLPQENMLPYMLANQFSGQLGPGGDYLSMLAATGALSQDELTPLLLSQQMGHSGDLFSMMALSGQLEGNQLLPYMLLSGNNGMNNGYIHHTGSQWQQTHHTNFGTQPSSYPSSPASNTFPPLTNAATQISYPASNSFPRPTYPATNTQPTYPSYAASINSQPTHPTSTPAAGLGGSFDLNMWRAAVIDSSAESSSE